MQAEKSTISQIIQRYLSFLSGTVGPSSTGLSSYHHIIMISDFRIISLSKVQSMDNYENPPTKVIQFLVTETNLYQVPREIQNIKVNITMVVIMSKQISL